MPPQAYTRDVLAAAYEWLRSQPSHVRELASNSDSLVALYMQSRRRPGSINHLLSQPQPHPTSQFSSSQQQNASNATSAETPNTSLNSASSEAFKKDLKTLAEGLKQFDDPAEMKPAIASAHALNTMPSPHSQPIQSSAAHAQPQNVNSYVSLPSQITHSTSPSSSSLSPSSLNLDARSAETLKIVQTLLNLSSEREALRMLIVIGYEKLKSLLPNS